MNIIDIFSRRSILALFCLLAAFHLFAETPSINQNDSPPAGYYVVVAAYYSNGIEYARKYASTFEEKDYSGQYAFFPEKQMFLVHLNHYSDFNEAIKVMRNVRKEGVKEDAWVYVYRPEEIPVAAEPVPPSPAEVTENKSASEPQAEVNKPVSASESIPEEPEPEPTSVPGTSAGKPEPEHEPEPTSVPGTSAGKPEHEPEPTSVPGTSAGKPEPEPEKNPYEGMYPVFFNLFQGVSTELIEGPIQIVDPVKARIITSMNANEWHHINRPSNIHEEVQLEADLFGYRKISHVIHLNDPLRDSTDYFVTVRGDSIMVDFELVRYHRGDIFTMYNVYFVTHSAIMRPESVYELDQLLAMFEENKNLEIILHGHTNGNSSGDMRYKPKDDINFFSTSGALEKTASAKELSEERANVVKRYLVNKGISTSRIQVKGWGGKRMLYKKTDPQAIKNVRVEIEIVKE